MIVDQIENLKNYESLNPLFKKVVEFIAENELSSLEPGRHEIEGNDLFVNIDEPTGRTREEAVLEIHHKMIDIQIPLGVEETYGYTPAALLPEVPFNDEKDFALFPGLKPQTFITLRPGQFIIFFPGEGHAPLVSEKQQFKKGIFKVLS